MSAALLAQHVRRAAHGLHTCGLCLRKIASGERYIDQRVADEGTVWTFRCHRSCESAYWSWRPDPDETYLLADLSDGHLPPCPAAWDRTPPPPCLCERNPEPEARP